MKKDLTNERGYYEETLDRFSELEEDTKHLSWGIMEIADQLIAP